MSEGKHTPGPWEMSRDAEGEYGIHADHGRHWAYVGHAMAGKLGTVSVTDGEAEANARLMAAAPELLAAALALLEFWGNGVPVHPGAEVVADLRSAVRKTKGAGP